MSSGKHATHHVSKPCVLALNADGIPAELRKRPQWVAWRLLLRDGRWSKVPFDAVTMRLARTNDPRTWRPFERALRRHQRGDADGVGFVFSKGDPYAGVDLDGCRGSETGTIDPWAVKVVAELRSYSEVSPSGTGIKVIVRGSLPCPGTGGRRQLGCSPGEAERTPEIEAYHYGRYFALTGAHVAGSPTGIAQRGEELAALWSRVFGSTQGPRVGGRQEPREHRHVLSGSDTQLLDCARRARNGARFAQLFDNGCLGAYNGDHSRADLALCGMLAFWANGDPVRIDRLFRQSALMRPKWNEQHSADGSTYGQMTIRRALGH